MSKKGSYPERVDMEHIENSWKKLEPLLDADSSKLNTIKRLRITIYKTAALFVLLLSSVTLYFMSNEEVMITHETSFGQAALIELPDKSVINLNGNSKLTYRKKWSQSEDREVWLEGEAYFSIRPTDSQQKFSVKTNDNLTVEVLGTEFNIAKRGGAVQVVLSSGKIRLSIEKDEQVEIIEMIPGDFVSYDETVDKLMQKRVDPQIYSSWKNKKLLFQDSELTDIIQMLEETYGLRVNVDDPELLKRSISGSAPNGNLELLLQGLSVAFGIDITLTGNTVSISSNKLLTE